MIQHVYSVICRRVLRDAPTDLISLIDCLHSVAVLPHERPTGSSGVLIPIDSTVFSLWTRADFEQPTRGVARLRLVTPDGLVLPGEVFEVDLTTAVNHRVSMPLAMHPFTVPGRYWHIVERGDGGLWTEVGRLHLDILVATPPVDVVATRTPSA